MSVAAHRALAAACLIAAIAACESPTTPATKNGDADWLARQENQDLEAAKRLYGPEGPPATAAEVHARHGKANPKSPTAADVHAAHHPEGAGRNL
jgi:hypothetical protein